jgi:hypothetical protein
MCEETVLDDWSPDSLRRWAFDESLILLEQDEDLVIGRRDVLPILMPLADDPTCPKADYILSSFDFYLMFVVLRGADAELSALHEAIDLVRGATRQKLTEWAALLNRRLLYRKGIGPVDRLTALKMGEDLLNGICRQTEISISSETTNAWVVQLSVPPFHRHKEWLTINKEAGTFTYTR